MTDFEATFEKELGRLRRLADLLSVKERKSLLPICELLEDIANNLEQAVDTASDSAIEEEIKQAAESASHY